MTSSDSLLKTRQVARALGVSVSTIKRWVDTGVLPASRTVGKHRLIRRSEALRFAREQGLPHEGLDLLEGDAIGEGARASLLEALRQGRGREARALIRGHHAAVRDGVELADELIRPVMERVGQCWKAGSIDVYHEHQATQIVSASIVELIAAAEATRDRTSPRPLAVGAASDGDPYVSPGLLGELVLREGGWDVRNLGVNLPLTSLAHAVRDYRPRLVFLSISHLEDEERFVRHYTQFFKAAAAGDVAVILGGRALRPEVRARLVYASYGDRMSHLREFARRVLSSAKAGEGEGAS